jgi:hypothetical protein
MTTNSPERVQEPSTYVIFDKVYSRIAYGSEEEEWGADRQPCHDCKVIKGQLHLTGCDAKRCPVCGGQAIGCDCEYEGDEPMDEESIEPT